MARQGQLLDGLIATHPNNDEQQMAFDSIMNSIIDFKNANQDDITEHVFHFIGGPGGTGKSALFKKLKMANLHQSVQQPILLHQILKVQQVRILYFHTQWRMRLMLMIRTLLHAI